MKVYKAPRQSGGAPDATSFAKIVAERNPDVVASGLGSLNGPSAAAGTVVDEATTGWLPATACTWGTCATLALKNKPTQTSAATVVQMPSSGDPAASVWQWSSLAVGVLLVGFGVWVVHAKRRSTVQ